MYNKNNDRKKNRLKNRNALAKGPSFLNQNTVLDLWYEK